MQKAAPRDVWFWIATFAGAGLAPKAPGTVGTFAAMFLWGPFCLFGTPWWVRLFAVLIIFGLGVVAADRVCQSTEKNDPQIVVIDEVAGVGLTLCFAAASWWSLLAGFLLFRLFDITKIWPVRWADRQLHGGFGVMADDMLAGIYGLGCLWLVERYLLPLLFV